ncbi:MAG: gluconokinase [Anaerolineae bacterium]
MNLVTLKAAQKPLLLVIDMGTSSLRALLFDGAARAVDGVLARRTYQAHTTADGGAELDPEAMFQAFASALDEVLALAPGVEIAAVATSSLAASLVGVDEAGRPLTPLYLYSDTRNAGAVEQLRGRGDWTPIYMRTGCPLHTGYLPARFLWLNETHRGLVEKAAHWLSLHEFLLLRLFGRSVVSHSLASWTGLMNRMTRTWDAELLEMVGVRPAQLSPLAAAQASLAGLLPDYATRWPRLAEIPFFPAIGDGATANVGSGCTDVTALSITIGTSGAMRVALPADPPPGLPRGLWVYTVDERRALLGGSLNNGGNVYAYLQRTCQLPEPQAAEQELAPLPPDGHGLTVLPFFAGERSTGYHGNARAAIVGLSLDSSPIQILQATLEAIALRIAAIYQLVQGSLAPAHAIVASGSALIHSPAWVQIIAHVLGRPVTISGEAEASARGAAVLGLESLGVIGDLGQFPAAMGATLNPDPAHHEVYLRARERQERLYQLLVENS